MMRLGRDGALLGMSPADMREFMSSPVPPGTVRTMNCEKCGAVIYVRFPGPGGEGAGDPLRHVAWHRELEGKRRGFSWWRS